MVFQKSRHAFFGCLAANAADPCDIVAFAISILLATLVISALAMFVYILTFYTLQPRGIRGIFFSIVDLLSGNLIPLPFLPDSIRGILELTPFAAATDIPLRIYSGDIAGTDILSRLLLQLFWLIFTAALGKLMMDRALRRAVIQGG